MNERISEAAEVIRRLLQQETAMSLAALVRAIPGATASLVALAVGWLARDETVTLTVEHSGLTVRLNERDTLRVIVDE